MLDCAGYGVKDVGPSRPGASPGQADKSVALEGCEMRADRIVGQLELGREFVDGLVALPEQSEDLAAGAFDQPFTPW